MTNTMCLHTQILFGFVFRYWGSNNTGKTYGPNQVINDLGYELDSTKMECRLPKKKNQVCSKHSICSGTRQVNIKATTISNRLIELCV